MALPQYALVALGCIVSYFVVTLIKTRIEAYRFAKAHGCKPPARYPQSERILGLGFTRRVTKAALEKRILPDGVSRFKEFGNTYSVVVMGQEVIVTQDPENIKTILATSFKDFSIGKRIESFGPLLGQGIFTSDGSLWEHSRALVRPSFTKTQVADLETFEMHIKHLIQKIPRDGSTVDLQPLFFQLTFDSATEFLFGESVDILRSPAGSEQQLFAAAFDAAQFQLSKRARLGPFVWLYRDKSFGIACKKVHNFVDKFVVKALEHRRRQENGEKSNDKEGDRYIFMNELAMATNDPIQIRSELLNILLAGRDTTAGLLSNVFHVLARRPDIWNKLQDEISELGGAAPDYETLRNMKYLKFVLNEGLRLYPSVPANARFAVRNTTVPVGGGPDGQSPLFVPKGGIVNYFPYAMHRRKDIYGEDADEFKPERWETLRAGWGYLPFNGGPRICVGQQFALTEASYTIVRVLQEFKSMEARDDRPWVEGLHITLSSGNGVSVAMSPKN